MDTLISTIEHVMDYDRCKKRALPTWVAMGLERETKKAEGDPWMELVLTLFEKYKGRDSVSPDFSPSLPDFSDEEQETLLGLFKQCDSVPISSSRYADLISEIRLRQEGPRPEVPAYQYSVPPVFPEIGSTSVELADKIAGFYEKGLRECRGTHRIASGGRLGRLEKSRGETGTGLTEEVKRIISAVPSKLLQDLGFGEKLKELKSLADERYKEADERITKKTSETMGSLPYGESWTRAAEFHDREDYVSALKAFVAHSEPFFYCHFGGRYSQSPWFDADFRAPIGFRDIVWALRDGEKSAEAYKKVEPILEEMDRASGEHSRATALSAVSSSRGVPAMPCYRITEQYKEKLREDLFPRLKAVVGEL